MLMDPDHCIPSCFWSAGDLGVVLELTRSDYTPFLRAKIVCGAGFGWTYVDYLDILSE
jgi:hypothetical protein